MSSPAQYYRDLAEFLAPDRLEQLRRSAINEFDELQNTPGFNHDVFMQKIWNEIREMEANFRQMEQQDCQSAQVYQEAGSNSSVYYPHEGPASSFSAPAQFHRAVSQSTEEFTDRLSTPFALSPVADSLSPDSEIYSETPADAQQLSNVTVALNSMNIAPHPPPLDYSQPSQWAIPSPAVGSSDPTQQVNHQSGLDEAQSPTSSPLASIDSPRPMYWISIESVKVPVFDIYDVSDLSGIDLGHPLLEQAAVLDLLSKQWLHQGNTLEMPAQCIFMNKGQRCGTINGNDPYDVTSHMEALHGPIIADRHCIPCQSKYSSKRNFVRHLRSSHYGGGVLCAGCGHKQRADTMKTHFEYCQRALSWLTTFVSQAKEVQRVRAQAQLQGNLHA